MVEKTIRVLLADDDDYVRESCQSFLRSIPGVTVIAETAHGDEAVALAMQHRPDVVLMDISMPRVDGFEATRQIRVGAPEVRVIMLTAHRDYSYVDRALRIGAIGFLVKSAAAQELPAALEAVSSGRSFISSLVKR